MVGKIIGDRFIDPKERTNVPVPMTLNKFMFFCVILKTDANIVNIPLWCLVSNHISPTF